MKTPIYQGDAFTDRPFAGNPAAVCLLAAPADDTWMQAVAQEMNLSETAFLIEENDGYQLRWFTPTVEVDLCGHATLASAHVLWSEQHVRLDRPIRFHTRSGVLTAARSDDRIELDFPLDPPVDAQPCTGLLESLAVSARYVGKGRFDYLVEVESEEMVRALQPDFVRLAQLPLRGVIVTARASRPDCDFVSRFFAPREGINEDPVTGSAHCCLGAYWGGKLARTEMVGHQVSARGGTVHVRVAGDRAILGGRAVTVVRGNMAAQAR